MKPTLRALLLFVALLVTSSAEAEEEYGVPQSQKCCRRGYTGQPGYESQCSPTYCSLALPPELNCTFGEAYFWVPGACATGGGTCTLWNTFVYTFNIYECDDTTCMTQIIYNNELIEVEGRKCYWKFVRTQAIQVVDCSGAVCP